MIGKVILGVNRAMALHLFSLKGLEQHWGKNNPKDVRQRVIDYAGQMKAGEFGVVDDVWDIWGLLTRANPDAKLHEDDRKLVNLFAAVRECLGIVIPRYTDTTQHTNHVDIDANSSAVSRVSSHPPYTLDVSSAVTHGDDAPLRGDAGQRLSTEA